MLEEVWHGIARGHHVGVLFCLCKILHLALKLVVKTQYAGNIAASIAVVGC